MTTRAVRVTRGRALPRALGALAAAALTGFVVGGTLARLGMRLLAVAEPDIDRFETTSGATVGEITAGGTVSVYVAALVLGVMLGAGYLAVRPILPPGRWLRLAVFALGAGLVSGALVLLSAEDDFGFAPVAGSLALVFATLTVTAAAVAAAVERVAPHGRLAVSGRTGLLLAGLGLVACAVLAGLTIDSVLDTQRVVP